ncbi:VOC family protein [Rhodobacteraceae bacterium RKSG542]|uniref:VOC family protein n=1 Tax=Pseudovibrio flavus TaxID=2529854 RepID=UPI0012BB728B|nr:VOC family protein [Pseudovibrio flavus]MTI16144.1 VOC family protein [Pseudovibrio flavus]
MANSFLEHVNVTVSDPVATANRLVNWFGWHIRWQGPAMNTGTTVHVGTDSSYIAVYTSNTESEGAGNTYKTRGGLNHIGVVVDDLDAAEKKILADGYKTRNHGDYEPGRRFYFEDEDGIEFEVVSYAS